MLSWLLLGTAKFPVMLAELRKFYPVLKMADWLAVCTLVDIWLESSAS